MARAKVVTSSPHASPTACAPRGIPCSQKITAKDTTWTYEPVVLPVSPPDGRGVVASGVDQSRRGHQAACTGRNGPSMARAFAPGRVDQHRLSATCQCICRPYAGRALYRVSTGGTAHCAPTRSWQWLPMAITEPDTSAPRFPIPKVGTRQESRRALPRAWKTCF